MVHWTWYEIASSWQFYGSSDCPRTRSGGYGYTVMKRRGTRRVASREVSMGCGVDLNTLVGRTLTRVRRSRTHPSLTLHFADGGAVQVRVVGYDPHFRGIPKMLESDSHILGPASGSADVKLTVKNATMITLADKAFQVHTGAQGARSGAARESRWTQKHAAFAIKFVEEAGWHCIWATLAEYDEKDSNTCVFRNFADVYIDTLHPTSTSPADGASARVQARTGSPHSSAISPVLHAPSIPKAQKQKQKNRKNKKGAIPKARW
ncbi:hypothetical protein BD414DRAFT_514071 [Trametes punicea]|nr:hypothetical protein BD414DRAFT_514071 [Trametes punicea]